VGTDYVRLFDKRLAEEIAQLDAVGIERFVAPRWSQIEESSFLRIGYEPDTPGELRVRELLASHYSLDALKDNLIRELCFEEGSIRIDYWGCYAEIFVSGPPRSISSREVFRDEEEQTFTLLLPDHIDQMLEGIEEHRDQLVVITPAALADLRLWRDRCALNSGLMVAYFFDF
jgi:hypothetical protein